MQMIEPKRCSKNLIIFPENKELLKSEMQKNSNPNLKKKCNKSLLFPNKNSKKTQNSRIKSNRPNNSK